MAASSSRLPAVLAGVEDERYSLPCLGSAPGDAELLEHLHARRAQFLSDPRRQAGVNVRLLWMDPSDLLAGRKEKYFVTDYSAVRSGYTSTPPATPSGFWKPRDLGWGIPGQSNGLLQFVGLKMTYDFHIGQTIYQEGNKTNWIMHVYFLVNQKYAQVEDDLVLCHVFENNPDHDPRPIRVSHPQIPMEKESLTPEKEFQPQVNHSCAPHSGDAYNQAMAGDSYNLQVVHGERNNNPFSATAPPFLPTHIACNQPLSPTSISYLEELEKLYCPETSVEPGNYNPNGGGVPSTVSGSGKNKGKRMKICSEVWQRFTKLFVKTNDKTVVLAACNHCYKILTGDSNKGTSHLKRHKCHCNH